MSPVNLTTFTGTIQFDEANPDQSSVEVTIKTASIDTGVKMRDDDLQIAQFFRCEKVPGDDFQKQVGQADRVRIPPM